MMKTQLNEMAKKSEQDFLDACLFASELNEAFLAVLDQTELVFSTIQSIQYDRQKSPKTIDLRLTDGNVYRLSISKIT